MKILMLSMFSSHFFNWVKQLENEGHEIYWIDVYDANTYVKKIDFVHQIVGWRNRLNYPGRYKIKKKFPDLYNLINKLNQRDLSKVFEKKLGEIRPDVIQTFEMFSSTLPIIEIMEKNPQLPWVYSIWGNDLFYFQKKGNKGKNLKRVLPRINYLFADCQRDFELAKKLGYQNNFVGVFPTGGGYDFKKYDIYIKNHSERNIILIKGYQHTFGRCNVILEAIGQMKESLMDYEIVVFGANMEVRKFAEKEKLHQWKNFKIFEQISHNQVLEIMGNSLIYIGNSISDGMPNTLLEAIIMGVFPIQSNPGGVTEEIITDGINGYLINDPEDPGEIVGHLKRALISREAIENAIEYNFKFIKPNLERNKVREKVTEKYRSLQEQINN